MIDGVIFDKDGTLFDFRASWGAWAARLLGMLAAESGLSEAQLGEAIGFDPAARRFAPDSVVIAGTPGEIARDLAKVLPGKILFEMEGVPEATAREAFRLASAKLSLPTIFVKRTVR